MSVELVSTACCVAMYICAARVEAARPRSQATGLDSATAPARRARRRLRPERQQRARPRRLRPRPGPRRPRRRRRVLPARAARRPSTAARKRPGAARPARRGSGACFRNRKREAKRRATHPWRRLQQRRCRFRAGRRVARRRGVRLSRWKCRVSCDMGKWKCRAAPRTHREVALQRAQRVGVHQLTHACALRAAARASDAAPAPESRTHAPATAACARNAPASRPCAAAACVCHAARPARPARRRRRAARAASRVLLELLSRPAQLALCGSA